MHISKSVALIAIVLSLSTACRRENPGAVAAATSTPAAAPESNNIYRSTSPAALSAVAAKARPLVYVPNLKSNSVTVIDPATLNVVRTFPVGKAPQHVVPSYDMTRLWVTNNASDSLTPIDPETSMPGEDVAVADPYNLYFAPGGKLALVIAEARHRIDFRDAVTMNLVKSTHVSCGGLDHLDFTADEKFAIATCEFSGQLVKIDMGTLEVVGYLKLQGRAMPQDIRCAPDGRVFYVADMAAGGVHVIDPEKLAEVGFIRTGDGAHGFVVGREGKVFYVANRGWKGMAAGRHGPGSVSVLDPLTREIKATWKIPGGGSPDMGNVTADGKQLWLSGRYDSEVYILNTETGELIKRIAVGREPHGLCVWPQPGRYSLGHTGNMR